MLDKISKVKKTVSKQVVSKVNKNKKKLVEKNPVEEENLIIALDIGTEFVKALIGRLDQSTSEIEIIGMGRKRQSLSDMQAGAISDIAAVVDNCDQALAQAEEQAGVSGRRAVIGIAGELVKGTTNTLKVLRRDPSQLIDSIEMEKIILLVQDRAKEIAKKQLSIETGGREVDVKLVNSALVGIEIDGYPITNPLGFQGKEVVIQLYTAFAPLVHIGALEKTALELDLDLLTVAAEPFAVSRAVLGNKISQNFSAILVDVGGGTTDIAVINDGGVQGTKMFGIGGRAFTKGIEKDLSVSYEMAEALKIGLSTQKIPVSKRPIIETIVNKTATTWISGIELALSEFDMLDHLPYRMFLCGGGSSLEVLANKLEGTDWYKNLPFTHKPTIHLIRPEQVDGIIDKTGRVKDHTFITAMGLLRIASDTLEFAGDEEEPAKVTLKDRIDKMMGA